MAGAPKGNTNSSKENRLWTNTLRRAVAQGNGDTLRRIAEKLINKALAGDMWAIKEIGNRLDGRPAQAIEAKTECKVKVITLNQYGPGNKSTE